MAAVVVIRGDMTGLQKHPFGGASMHGNFKFSGLLVQFHGEIGGFFIEGMAPVKPTALDPVFHHQIPEISQKLIGEEIPEVENGGSAALFLKIFEQLTISRNKFGARYHFYYLYYP
jgi:hypothetical protein